MSENDAVRELRKLLKPGSRVYCVLRHVSRSGMTRLIDFYTIRKGEMRYLTGYIGEALGYARSKTDDGLIVRGCGMDMGFHVVYSLGRMLFPKGFIPAKIGKNYGRNGAPATDRDADGGYALEHSWL